MPVVVSAAVAALRSHQLALAGLAAVLYHLLQAPVAVLRQLVAVVAAVGRASVGWWRVLCTNGEVGLCLLVLLSAAGNQAGNTNAQKAAQLRLHARMCLKQSDKKQLLLTSQAASGCSVPSATAEEQGAGWLWCVQMWCDARGVRMRGWPLEWVCEEAHAWLAPLLHRCKLPGLGCWLLGGPACCSGCEC